MNAVKIIENAKYNLGNYIISHDEYEKIIEPLKDVEPVTHAHWIKSKYGDFICSCCHIPNCAEGDFCSWCGAKMDEEVEE